jgi:Tfp pilus assembly protein PilF
VAASPDPATAYYNLALALAKTGDGEAAEASLRSAIEHAPGFFAAYLKLGQLLAARHRPDLAEPYLRRAAESPDARLRKAAQDLLNAPR